MEGKNKKENNPVQYQYVDVSEPRDIRTEREIIAEERAEYRRMLFRKYRVYIFLAIGVILVGLAILFARVYHSNTNPWSRLMKASSKNFDAPFKFEMSVSKGDKAVMEYNGVVNVTRSSQKIKAYYDAKYSDYSYSAALDAEGVTYVSGSLYDGKWHVSDCEEQVHDFFDFDTDYRKGKFDAGAFLRFTKLNTAYSSAELQRFIDSLSERLSSDSDLAKITVEEKDGVTNCRYDIDLTEFFKLVENDGASIFYRSADYDTFKKRFAASKDIIAGSTCVLEYTIDSGGYLSALKLDMVIDGEQYSVSLGFSDFGNAKAELPEEFIKAEEELKEQ